MTRILVTATLLNTLGNGAYMTVSALFLTRSVGLTPGDLAIGLAAAALMAVVFSAPLGYLADRIGPKAVQIGALLALACCYSGLILVHDLWSFVALACMIALGEATAKGANGAMIASAVPPDQRVRLRALVRSANNGGLAVGTLLGGLPLMLDTRAAYVTVLLANSVTFALSALVLSRAPRVAPLPAPADSPRMVALRDRPFLSFALVDGLMASMYNGMLTLALPLWLLTYTKAPLWLVSAALLINTLGCVFLQVWASRGVEGPEDAIRVGRRGALIVAASCVLFGLTAGLPAIAVGTLVILAAIVHVLGELWLSNATWAVVYGLAPDWAQGQYQGAYMTGRQIGGMLTPPLLAGLVISGGTPGWVAVGAIFAVAGLIYPAIVSWGLRTRLA